MFPILYSANATKQELLNTNGLGFIKNCSSCRVSEERNGVYEVDMSVLRNDRLGGNILPGMFVKAKTPENTQLFYIYSTIAEKNKVQAKARHIKYLANDNLISESFTKTGTPQAVWDYIEEVIALPLDFSFSSDITTQSTVSFDRLVRLGDFFGGVDGSLLDAFGGEYKYDNFNISLLNSRGTDTGVCLRYGSGISSLKQECSSATVYSHFYPYAYVKLQDTQGQLKGERAITTLNTYPLNTSLSYKRALAYDFTNDFFDEVLIVSNSGAPADPTEAARLTQKLDTLANAYISGNRAALTQLSVSITIDTENGLKQLSSCNLCDTVLVYYEPFGISTRAKIVKTEYDCLLERYTKIQLGQTKKTLADLINVKNIGGA